MITTSVPSSKRRAGPYVEHKFEPSGQQLISLPLRIVAVGIGGSGATSPVESPVQVLDETDADLKAGASSELAMMLRKMFEQCAIEGGKPEIWACRIAAPAGVATANTITVTGPATASGTLVLRVAGRTINVGVSNGDSATTVAAAIKAAIDVAAKTLPLTAAVVGAVVTTTHGHVGVTGNDVAIATQSGIAGVGVAHAQSVAGTGIVDITNAVDALYDKQYDGIAIANHAAADMADIVAHLAAAWGYSQQKPRFLVVGDRTSLGSAQALATAANAFNAITVSCEGSGSLPGELAAAACASWFSNEAPNVNMDGRKLLVYAPTAALAYTDAEVEAALAGGVTPLTPLPDGYTKLERLVATVTTVGPAPAPEALRDPATTRTAAYVGQQVSAQYSLQFQGETLATDPEEGLSVLDRVRDMVVAVLRAAQTQKYTRDVDLYLDRVIVEESTVAAGRINAAVPVKAAGPLHQGVFVINSYL